MLTVKKASAAEKAVLTRRDDPPWDKVSFVKKNLTIRTK